MNILEKLGIYGITQTKENAILACLLTGDPILLIGKPGTAKTALSNQLGAALRERSKKLRKEGKKTSLINYIAYDASKLNFEDLIGIPNPKALSEGKIDFIKTPMTVWNKHLVTFDEFNRQEASRQANILELIRSRTILGVPTKTKWIINCMNPFGSSGTEMLDEVLIDRHAFFVFIDDFHSLNNENRNKIIQHISTHDAIALNYWGTKVNREFDNATSDNLDSINDKVANVGIELVDLLKKAATFYKELESSVGSSYSNFLDKFISTFSIEMQEKDWKVYLSGRRAGMIYRSVLAYRAVELAKADLSDSFELPALKDTFKAALQMSIPIGIASNNSQENNQAAYNTIFSNIDLYSNFFTSISNKNSNNTISQVDVIYELLTTNRIERKIEILINELDDDFIKNQVWPRLLDLDNTNNNLKDKNAILISMLAHLMTIDPNIVPENTRSIIVGSLAKANTILDQKTIKLFGHATTFKEEIEGVVNSLTNEFSKLQAMILFQNFFANRMSAKVSKKDFESLKEEVESTCKSLEGVINNICKV